MYHNKSGMNVDHAAALLNYHNQNMNQVLARMNLAVKNQNYKFYRFKSKLVFKKIWKLCKLL